MKRLWRGVWAAALMAGGAACADIAFAQAEVSIPSADLSRGPGLMLKGFWFEAAASAAAPAVVLLHGCNGPYDKRGVLSPRMRDYAALLNRLGMHALVVDSLTPRGETQICTQKVRSRLITQANRRLDTQSSLEWLAARPDVDAARLGLMGWSDGGSTVLATTNEHHKEVADAEVKPSFAVAFYPGCETEARHGFATRTRLLLLLGELDDWTPPLACRRLAARAPDPRPEVETYRGAYHGFDSGAPVRLRTDVPNGLDPGKGVHVGGNAQALEQSHKRLLQFLAAVAASTPSR